MNQCQLCQYQDFLHQLDFGHQPVSHRYSNDEYPDHYSHPIKMGQCKKCGLVQILTPFPVTELIPKFSWLTCTEPEGHLDRLVETLTKLPGINTDSKIIGLTFKEDTTLTRFNKLGFNNTYRFDMASDFEVKNEMANIETAVDFFNEDFAKRYVAKNGKCDIFICRHVIEHSVNISHFVAAIKELTHNQSYVIIEIPECGSAFDLYDYTTVWEEHNLYFTPELFKSFLKNSGFSIFKYIQEPYPLEDACIAIVQKSQEQPPLEYQQSNYQNFVLKYDEQKKCVREKLTTLKSKGKLALFGAGHMSVAFVNLMGVEDLIDFIVDDNVHKSKYYLPGTKIKIHPSSILYSENIKTCLMTLAPDSEEKVSKKHQVFVDQGGDFFSIFCKNPTYFLK